MLPSIQVWVFCLLQSLAPLIGAALFIYQVGKFFFYYIKTITVRRSIKKLNFKEKKRNGYREMGIYRVSG